MRANEGGASRIHDLESLLTQQNQNSLPPVEQWNPPHRREIGLEILRDGTWLYQGSPITRSAMVRLFASVLRRDADGRYVLVTPVEMVDITVQDAPFLAVELQVDGTGRAQQLVFRTNVGDIVQCGPEHPLRFETEAESGGLKPYVHVRGRLEALVTRALYYDLVELATQPGERPQGMDAEVPGIWSGGQFFRLA